jgi:hypothetical protein
MKIGLFAMNYGTCGDPHLAVQVAQAAEAAGFESVWIGEHIVLPNPMLSSFPLAPETPMLDTAVALTWIAAHTKRVRIASDIIIVPQRNPVLLAKELTSVDVVSGDGSLSVSEPGGSKRNSKLLAFLCKAGAGKWMTLCGPCERCGRWTGRSTTVLLLRSIMLRHILILCSAPCLQS